MINLAEGMKWLTRDRDVSRISRLLVIAGLAALLLVPCAPVFAQRPGAAKRLVPTPPKRPVNCSQGCWEVTIAGKVFRGDKAFFLPGQPQNVVLTHQGFNSGVVHGGVVRSVPLVSAGEYETDKRGCWPNEANQDEPDPLYMEKFQVGLDQTPHGSLFSMNGKVFIDSLTKTRVIGRFMFSGFGDAGTCSPVPVSGTFTAVVVEFPAGWPGT